MRRRLSKIAAFVSTTLFLLTLAGWTRSYFRVDDAMHIGHRFYQYFVSAHGTVTWVIDVTRRGDDWATIFDRPGELGWHARSVGPPEWDDNPIGDIRLYGSGALGCYVSRAESYWFVGGGSYPKLHIRRSGVMLPYWLVALASATYPAIRFVRYQAKRLGARRGGCPRCGYDLRATPDRCPECGLEPGEIEGLIRTEYRRR